MYNEWNFLIYGTIFDIIQIVVQDYITKQINIMLNKILKPFNLEEYLANPSRKVVTRCGLAVTRFLCTDRKHTKPIVACIEDGCTEVICFYAKDGKVMPNMSTDFDLFFAPEKHEGWVNVYKSESDWSLGASIWQTEEEAKKWVGAADYATTIKIEWEA